MGIPFINFAEELLDDFRRFDAANKIRDGWRASKIYDSWKGTQLKIRQSAGLRLIREVLGNVTQSYKLSAVRRENFFDPEKFTVSNGRMAHKYYVDAEVTRTSRMSGITETVKRRVWFDEAMTRRALDSLFNYQSGGEYDDEGYDLENIRYIATAKRGQ